MIEKSLDSQGGCAKESFSQQRTVEPHIIAIDAKMFIHKE